MEKQELIDYRKRLKKTQKQLSQVLGVSAKAVNSYEQGWRNIPMHIERQLLLLISKTKMKKETEPCWKIKSCSKDRYQNCPAWEFDSADICWLINGTICEGVAHAHWNRKMQICRSCIVLQKALSA